MRGPIFGAPWPDWGNSLADQLFLFSGLEVDAARAAHRRGEKVVAGSEAAAAALSGSSIPFARALSALGDDPEMLLYRAAADWTKAFGSRAKDNAGQTLKEALRYRNTTLWWWAELYLHHNTEAVRHVRFIEQMEGLFDLHRPESIHAHGAPSDDAVLLARLCGARGIGFRATVTLGARERERANGFLSGLVEASKVIATAVKRSREEQGTQRPKPVVFISHAAFWRTRPAAGGRAEDYEHYLDAILSGSARRGFPVVTLGVGPQNTFRTRSRAEKWKERLSAQRDDRFLHVNTLVTARVAAAALKAFGRAVSINHRFGSASGLVAAFSHRGVPFLDLAEGDLARTLLLQVPWAARCLLEFETAFRALDPRLVCLYAETSGLGRAAITAAQGLSVKTLGLQHGILYPNYFSYERSPEDLALGTPIADTTVMYGEEGVRMLETVFRYPKGRVVVAGSPGYDALAAELKTVNREERRQTFGLAPGQKLVILASRYKGIRDTHKASGPAFAGLLAAIKGIEGALLIVKPHPAEPADAYDKDIAEATAGDRVRVVMDRSLSDLLPAADLLITVESLSATEALVASVPVIVLRHPSNLREMVANGAAMGVAEGDNPTPFIEALLNNPETRARWQGARDAFLQDVAHGVDGAALDRLLNLVSQAAGLD